MDKHYPMYLTDEPWAKGCRCLPNELCRYQIFSVGTSKARQSWDIDEPLEVVRQDGSSTELELFYAGKELRQDDLDVYLELLHNARTKDLLKPMTFNRADFMSELGYKQTSFYYKKLLDCMRRLSAANIEGVITRTNGEDTLVQRFNFNLVDSFQYKEQNGNMAREWVYRLPIEIMAFFLGNGFSRVDVKRRRALGNNQIAKWLQMYFATHRINNKYAIKVEAVRELCGSSSQQMFKFRQQLNKAFKLLKSLGIADAYIEDGRICRRAIK